MDSNTYYDITLWIGHNVDGKPALSGAMVEATTLNVLELQGATFSDVRGIWQGEREESTRVDICHMTQDEVDDIRARVPYLASVLNQDSIMLAITPSYTEFIAAQSVTATSNN